MRSQVSKSKQEESSKYRELGVDIKKKGVEVFKGVVDDLHVGDEQAGRGNVTGTRITGTDFGVCHRFGWRPS